MLVNVISSVVVVESAAAFEQVVVDVVVPILLKPQDLLPLICHVGREL